jgi:hypothetical protein
MRFKGVIVFTGLLLLWKLQYSQELGSKSNINSFGIGEKVSYNAVYNWGFIWINAGEVVFSVRDTFYNGKNQFYFKSSGWSLKKYDWFYKVRERFESIASKDSLKPYWFQRDSYEGGYVAHNEYNFDYKSALLNINSFTSERRQKLDNVPLMPNTYDVLSAIYFCRNINFDSLSIDQKVPLSMVIDNEVFNLFIRYLGRETITIHGGKTYTTHKFSAMLVKGTIFKGGEDLFVWVTDDKYHIPVIVEAKILVGSVKAVLVSVERY